MPDGGRPSNYTIYSHSTKYECVLTDELACCWWGWRHKKEAWQLFYAHAIIAFFYSSPFFTRIYNFGTSQRGSQSTLRKLELKESRKNAFVFRRYKNLFVVVLVFKSKSCFLSAFLDPSHTYLEWLVRLVKCAKERKNELYQFLVLSFRPWEKNSTN